ncbi:MAG: maleylpyruvate isomerase family mycothiol-dependent enzyme [Microthrixaceae bacterium]
MGDENEATAAEGLARRRRSHDQLLVDFRSLSAELLSDFGKFDEPAREVESLCLGWSVRDVLLHFAAGDARATEVLDGADPFPNATPEESVLVAMAERDLASFGDLTVAAAYEECCTARERLLGQVSSIEEGEWQEYVPWGAKPITRFSLVQSRLMETWVHGWDARWPMSVAQLIDDRAWWVTDMAVRHMPYTYAKAGLPVPDLDYTFELTGIAGGHWERSMGDQNGATSSVTVAGLAWAWVVLASQRAPGRIGVQYLSAQPPEARTWFFEHARCFA